MATPYNLRSRKRDPQPLQADIEFCQPRRKTPVSSKVMKETRTKLERTNSVNLSSDRLPVNGEEERDVTQKCLKWEEDEMEEEKEGVYEEKSQEEEGEANGHGVIHTLGGGGGDDSDSEGPEDVPLMTAKQNAIQQLHRQKLETDSSRKTLKRRRREMHELYKQQKEDKRQEQMRRLSQEDLQRVTAALTASKEDERGGEGREGKHRKMKLKRKGLTPLVQQRRVGRINVVAMETQVSNEPCAAAFESAQEFLNNRLYGNRCCRAPALTLQAKRYCSLPAKNFHRSATT